MKKSLSLFLAFCFVATSCQTMKSEKKRKPSSLQAANYVLDAGMVKLQPGDPEYIDPALEDDEVDAETLLRMQRELEKLASIQMADLEPASLAMPDYDVASKALRGLIKQNVSQYFLSLESIKKKVTRTLSELLALKRAADSTGLPGSLFHQQYERDVKNKIPSLNREINADYAKAIKDLYNLGGQAVIMATKNRDAFKGRASLDLKSGLYGVCETALCIAKLEADLEQWHSYVINFNNRVDFTDFNGSKTSWSSKKINPAPIVTMGLIDAANDLMKMGLDKNKDYSIPGIVAKNAVDILKQPVGVGLLIISAPVYAFENTGKAVDKFFSLRAMKVQLTLNSLDTYPEKRVLQGFRSVVENAISKMSQSAIYVHQGEDRSDILTPVFDRAMLKATSLGLDVADSFSVREIVHLDQMGIIAFSSLLEYLSPKRLEELASSRDLTQEQKSLANLRYREKFPAMISNLSNEEIIHVLSFTSTPQIFLPYLSKERKAELFKLAPDLTFLGSNTPAPAPTTPIVANGEMVFNVFHGTGSSMGKIVIENNKATLYDWGRAGKIVRSLDVRMESHRVVIAYDGSFSCPIILTKTSNTRYKYDFCNYNAERKDYATLSL